MPPVAGHRPPQRPQFSALVRRSTSQPLEARPSQLPKFALHVRPQTPAAHEAAAAHAHPARAGLDELVARRASPRELLAAARDQGFRSLAEDGSRRVLEGHTSLEELARVVDLTDRMRP